MTTYTLVRHSGYDLGGKEDFAFAVESRAISGRQIAMVERAGGLVFDSYEAADRAEYAENYPPEVTGIIPHINGIFSARVKIDGSPLYIPAKAEVTNG